MLTPEQVQSYRDTYKINPVGTPTPATKDIKPKGSSIGSRVSSDISQAGTRVQEAISGEGEFAGQSPIRRGMSAVSAAASAVPKVASELLPQPIRTGIEKTGEAIGKGFNAVTEKIGSSPELQKWTQEHPDAFNRLNEILGTASAGGEIAGNILGAKGAAIAGQKAITTAGKVATGAITKGAPIAGRVLKGVGETAYRVGVSPEETTKIAMQKYRADQPNLMGRIKNIVTDERVGDKPITEMETAARVGLAGTERGLGDQAARASKDIWEGVIAPKLDAVKGKVNMKSFVDQIEKEIAKETKGIRRTALKESLDAFRDEFKNVSSISLRKLQDYKEEWAKFLPDSSYKGKPIANSLKEVQNIAAKKAREIIYKHIGEDGKQAYLDYGNLKSIMKAGIKAEDPLRSKSFTKQAWEFVLDNTVTPVATMGGKVLYRTGQGLEFVGKKGAKKVKDIVNN